MNITCSAKACPVLLSASCVFYEGVNLPYTGINMNDNLQIALQKIDETFNSLFDVNIYVTDGTLTGDRVVSMAGHPLSFNGGNVAIGNTSPLSLLHVGDRGVTNSSNPVILISRNVTSAFTSNTHAFSDSSLLELGTGLAYNSFDARVDIGGSNNIDHYAGFQHGINVNKTGTITNIYGLFTNTTISAGAITNNYGVYAYNPTGAGTITNNFGLYVANLSKGSYNYAVHANVSAGSNKWNLYISGSANNYIQGTLLIGTNAISSYKLDVVGGDARFNGVRVGRGPTNNISNLTIGYNSFQSLTSGFDNLSIGYAALQNQTDGDGNVALGSSVLTSLTSASYNTAIGYNSGNSFQTGQSNTFIGNRSALALTSGSYNIVLGGNTTWLTSGSYNTIIGNLISGVPSTLYNNLILANGAGQIIFRYDGTDVSIPILNGVGTRMVVADATGVLSTQAILTLTTTGSSGASTLISDVLNVPTYTLAGLGGVPTTRTLTINGTGYDLSADRSWSVGTVTSVGISVPSAFSVSNSPVTTSGTIAITGAGLASQYVRGDGALGDFPSSGGGGSSVSYYLNGSVNQGTFGGSTYYEMNRTPIVGGPGTNFSITNTTGLISQFITDPIDPGLLLLPGGNWNIEFYFNASDTAGAPYFYVELYIYNGTTFTLVSSGVTNPEYITNGPSVDIYYTSIAVPETTLSINDRLAIRVYGNTDGNRTITLHTEDDNLSQIITTFANGVTAINGLTRQVQYLGTSTTGTDFTISSLVDTHTFNIPSSSATSRGLLTSTDWSIFNGKQPQLNGTGFVKASGTTISYDNSTYYLASNPSAYIALTALSAGTGISYNNLTGVITNTAPDKTVSLANGTAISVTGTYPNFTITNTAPDQTVTLSNGTSISVTGTYPGFTITNTAPDQIVSLTQGGTTVITGTYPNFTISSSDAYVGTVTSIATTGPITGGTITTSGTIGITQATTSTNGYLSSTDWNTFNSKQPQLNGTGFVKASGTTISYDNSTYLTAAITSLGGLTASVQTFSNDTNVTITSATSTHTLGWSGQLSVARGGTGLSALGTGLQLIRVNAGATALEYFTPTYINLTSLSASSPLLYNNTTGAFTIQVATSLQNGYLSNTDWSTFNGKQSAITLTTTGSSGASTFISNTLNIPNYTLSGLGGVPTSRTLTINGTSYDLSADRSWTVPDTNIFNTSGTLTSNRYIYGSGYVFTIQDINSLIVDSTGITNNVGVFKAVEPNVNIQATGATNGAALFLSPSNSGINGSIHNRTGGGLEFYVGSTPSVKQTIKATGQIQFNGYTSTGSFSGSAAGYLGFDSSGNVITTAGTGGIILTTTGSSGAATWDGTTLNIPVYTGGGGGSVTTVSVVSANGFAGTVANATSTPAITLTTTVSGILKGNSTSISAASAGLDYQAPITLTTTGSSGAATFAGNVLNIPNYGLLAGVNIYGSDGTLTGDRLVSSGGYILTIEPYTIFTTGISLTKSLNNLVLISATNLSSSSNASIGYSATSDAGSGTLYKYSLSNPGAGTYCGPGDLVLNNSSSGNIVIRNIASSKDIRIVGGTNLGIVVNSIGNALVGKLTQANSSFNLDVNGVTNTGGFSLQGTTFTANATATLDRGLYVYAGTGTATLTLFDSLSNNAVLFIKNNSASVLTVAAAASRFIQLKNGTNVSTQPLAANDTLLLISNGLNHYIQI